MMDEAPPNVKFKQDKQIMSEQSPGVSWEQMSLSQLIHWPGNGRKPFCSPVLVPTVEQGLDPRPHVFKVLEVSLPNSQENEENDVGDCVMYSIASEQICIHVKSTLTDSN